MELSKEELIARHKELHKGLDQLVACYITESKKNLTGTNLMEFMEWSFQQTINPSCFKENEKQN